MSYQKRMPADWVKKIEEGLTFLNDKKINGELYAYFMSQSYGKDGKTIVEKKKLPTQAEICEIIGIKSRTTYGTHLKYLISRGYIKEDKENNLYILLNPESMYFEIPQDTLEYLNNVAHEQVIKAFICLGQMWKYGQSKKEFYVFSKKELGMRIGINMTAGGGKQGYKIINDILSSLINNNLIEIEEKEEGLALTYFCLDNNFSVNNIELIEENKIHNNNQGYVYITKVLDYYKIGITKNPKQRFGEYTKLMEKPQVIIAEQCNDYKNVEKILHKRFIEKKTNGEWFKLNEKELNEAIKIIKENMFR